MWNHIHGSRKKKRIIFATVCTLCVSQLTLSYLKVSNKWHSNQIYRIILELQRIVWSFSVPLVRQLVNSCFFVSNAMQSNQYAFFRTWILHFSIERNIKFHRIIITTNVNNKNASTIMNTSGCLSVEELMWGGKNEEEKVRKYASKHEKLNVEELSVIFFK